MRFQAEMSNNPQTKCRNSANENQAKTGFVGAKRNQAEKFLTHRSLLLLPWMEKHKQSVLRDRPLHHRTCNSRNCRGQIPGMETKSRAAVCWRNRQAAPQRRARRLLKSQPNRVSREPLAVRSQEFSPEERMEEWHEVTAKSFTGAFAPLGI